MTHESTTVAAYIAGELPADAHAMFERHLLTCEACWQELELGRRGRQLAELARAEAPPDLRRRVAETLVATSRQRQRRTRIAVVAAAACLAVVAAIFVDLRGTPTAPIAAAVAGFRSQRLPGSLITAATAPDLTAIGFTQTAGAAGDLAGMPVTAYGYRDGAGRRLLIYIGHTSFDTPADARRYEGGDAWISRENGVSVLCSRSPHATLVVGDDEQRVTDAAEYLKLT